MNNGNERLYDARMKQIQAVADLLVDYFQREGDVSPTEIKRIAGYKYALALAKSDKRLAPAVTRYIGVINAVQQDNFELAAQRSIEMGAIVNGVDRVGH